MFTISPERRSIISGIALVLGECGATVYVSGFPTHLELERERPNSRALLETLECP